MVSFSLSNKRYTYIHESESKPTREAIDIHHVIINGSKPAGYARRRGIGFFLVLLASSMHFLLGEDNPVRTLSWICLLSGFLVMLQSRKIVKKESVIIMPTFGIQLETQYLSGKTISRFIPIGKILKPVLVECVTPVTCYWSLSLFLRGEEQLTLVFKELRPPLKILVPIWKALCAVIGTEQSETIAKEEHDVAG
ncbi:hypothetical protein CARUB_v10005791mg [Capsella rubella]|uniref:Phosphatidylinositol N-acetylglucosaminyltransferase subunit H conserved domain-containing protein n=1 Tax=Capsella rubella TaxID=81985 RepID=R0F237_9BRAS|nr:uncharacterized protein LOC17879365 [Capsella rubella]EOA15366.1 hypothetical protein CARUB_v10005791mg [Capsella rubella]